MRLVDLYDADRRTRDSAARELAAWLLIPHPLHGVEYADGADRCTHARRCTHPAGGRAAR